VIKGRKTNASAITTQHERQKDRGNNGDVYTMSTRRRMHLKEEK
jgi:hypothetical protein